MNSFLTSVLFLLGPVLANLPTVGPELVFRRVNDRHRSGDQLWILELKRNGKVVDSWRAASGAPTKQSADRFWSPGNAAPLPPGTYRLGQPEPWDNSYWIDLTPTFPTSRSALGIHTCLPGVGCICLPDKADTAAVVKVINSLSLKKLTVLN
jgi:hypothetical protein